MGDISERRCALWSACYRFARLERFLPRLWRPEFDLLSDQDIFYILDAALFGWRGSVHLEDVRTEEEVALDSKRYRYFSFLNNWGEQFDYCGKSFILRVPNGPVRVLICPKPDDRVITLEAGLDEVLGAIRSFQAWIELQEARLSKKWDA